MTKPRVKGFDKWLGDRVPPQHHELACELYELARAAFPRFEESIKWGNPCFSSGGTIRCYIMAHTNHVNLGFFKGTSLTNRHGLLEGTGKELRHVKVAALTPELAEQLTELVAEAGR